MASTPSVGTRIMDSALVRELIDLSRLQGGEPLPDLVPVQVDDVIVAVIRNPQKTQSLFTLEDRQEMLAGEISLWPIPGKIDFQFPGTVRGWRMAPLEGILNGLSSGAILWAGATARPRSRWPSRSTARAASTARCSPSRTSSWIRAIATWH